MKDLDALTPPLGEGASYPFEPLREWVKSPVCSVTLGAALGSCYGVFDATLGALQAACPSTAGAWLRASPGE